jgi:hypothetical protein
MLNLLHALPTFVDEEKKIVNGLIEINKSDIVHVNLQKDVLFSISNGEISLEIYPTHPKSDLFFSENEQSKNFISENIIIKKTSGLHKKMFDKTFFLCTINKKN